MGWNSTSRKNVFYNLINCEIIGLRLVVYCFLILIFALAGLGKAAVKESNSPAQEPSYLESVNTLKSQAYQILQSSLEDKNPAVRVNAIEAIASASQNELMPNVQKLLKDDFVPVRFAAVLAIADMKYLPAQDSIKKLLKDDENVKIAAAYALEKLGSYDSYKILSEAIISKNQTVRANAAMLFGKTGSDKALKPLYWALRDNASDYKTKFQAVEAIAKLGDEKILPTIWAMALSTYADDRAIGVKAIGALGTQKARDILITKLDDEVLEIRLEAAHQLGILNNTTGEPEVLEVFTKKLTKGMDKKDLERVYALTALAIGKIKTPALIVYLPNLLENESKFVRIAAAEAALNCSR